MKKSQATEEGYLGLFILFAMSLLFSLVFWIAQLKIVGNSYRLYMKFEDASGIYTGTLVKFRGSPIGKVISTLQRNSDVLAAVEIHPATVVIPQNSIVEANQSGLLSETVIDLIPLCHIKMSPKDNSLYNPLPISNKCNSNVIMCHGDYIQGEKGINYDDLVRATTRLSQRFDDPDLHDDMVKAVKSTSNLAENLTELSYEITSIMRIIRSQIENLVNKELS
nr:ORF193 [Cavernulicola chilensis]